MPRITYLLADGGSRTLEVAIGTSVMQAAVNAGVPGIVGECGGSAMCATCHVYVVSAPPGALAERGAVEDGMLDSTACERTAASRLGCQLVLDGAADGLVVRVPERQM